MARDSFLLRIDPQILDAVRRWAEDEFRSVNGQIEYLLRASLRDAGRLEKKSQAPISPEGPEAKPPG
ncbi:MAG: Arc family DNA-binding protein [Planctomycetaceae bacterium]|nr:Arc family DNA-binding protein [Planctomycetaceae bacterium]